MKVVHLNTHSYGGAAVVARRLHMAGLASGLESHFITRYSGRPSEMPGHRRLQDARLQYFLRRQSARPQLHRLGKFVQGLRQHANLVNRPAGLEIFSPLNDQLQFADCVDSFDPDVIHLHWVSGFLDHERFFRHNRERKFVWTLHDMNPFTGGCHHAQSCTKFVGDCSGCPQLHGTRDVNYSARIATAKAEALVHLSDEQLVVTAPSRWLLDLSRQSRLMARFRHVHIENPSLAPAAVQPVAERRAALGLPIDRKIVLFISDNLRNPRKGIDLLFEAGARLPNSAQFHFIGLGQRTDGPRGLSVSFPGSISSEALLAQYFACADVVVVPSVAENSPLVIIEALTNGTPVVAFDVGGVAELIGPGCGIVVKERSADALALALQEVVNDSGLDRKRIMAGSTRFAPAAVLTKYCALYRELLCA